MGQKPPILSKPICKMKFTFYAGMATDQCRKYGNMGDRITHKFLISYKYLSVEDKLTIRKNKEYR